MGLKVGDSLNAVCPFCEDAFIKQGRPTHIWTPHDSLSVTRVPEGLLYNCFRATCTGGGMIPDVFRPERAEEKPKFKAHDYMYSTRALTKKERMFLVQDYGLYLPEIHANGIVYSPERDCYIFPILNEEGHVKGYLERNFKGRKPKTLNYWFEDVPKMHFPDSWDWSSTGSILLVEDTMSAIKASRYTHAASLLGTNLTTEVMQILSKLTDSVVIALDEDASAKALKLKKKYSLLFLNFSVRLLSKDIKNMSTDELEEFFVL